MKEEKKSGNKITLKSLLVLQLVVMLFSLTSVAAKLTSGEEVMTIKFFFYFGLEIFLLGVYAIAWQQVIKHFDISIAYANKAMVLLWGMLWGVMFFGDSVTLKKVLGVALVIAGVMVLNRGEGAHVEAAPAAEGEEEVQA